MAAGRLVVVVGAGPVGCVAAAALAATGAHVTLIEPTVHAPGRFAGELLHPAAVRVLVRHGLAPLPPAEDHEAVRGFAVSGLDAGPVRLLAYPPGEVGWTFPFDAFVAAIRERTVSRPGITWRPGWRVEGLTENGVEVRTSTGLRTLPADLVVGADGRFSKVRQLVGLRPAKALLSHMAGLTLRGVALPNEGFGHVMLTPAGPALAYRIGPDRVRVCLDVPIAWKSDPTGRARLAEAVVPSLPEALRAPVAAALSAGEVQWARNEVVPRTTLVSGRVALVGDAAGQSHPMTACGMLLGFEDADALARAPSLAHYAAERRRSGAAPAALSTALYEIFAVQDPAAAALRGAIADLWTHDHHRQRTLSLLAGLDADPSSLAAMGGRMVSLAAARVVRTALADGDVVSAVRSAHRLTVLTGWLARRTLFPSAALPAPASLPSTPFSDVRKLPLDTPTERAA